MRKLKIACVVVAGLSLAAGCEREEKGTTVSPPTGSTPSAAAPTTGPVQTPGQATADAQAVGSAATAGARSAVEQGTAGAADAQTQAAATAELTGEQAKTMLDQAMQYVKQNKYDLAEKTLNQVEAHKTSLPKTLQDQIATVRTALTTAKAGGGLQVPGLGGSPAK